MSKIMRQLMSQLIQVNEVILKKNGQTILVQSPRLHPLANALANSTTLTLQEANQFLKWRDR